MIPEINQTTKLKPRVRWFIYAWPNALVVILWLLAWYFVGTNEDLSGWPEKGSFGDMFGAVTSLFSGLAFAWIIITVYLQSQELSLQRQELELTRAEIRGQKEQLEQQNETLRIQKFENTFFQMLQLHHEIVNSMEQYVGQLPVRGRKNFERFYSEFVKAYEAEFQKNPYAHPSAIIKGAYSNFYNQNEPALGHYFRNLYNILKFVDLSQVTNKRFYTNLIRAQLSAPELLLLFYNCLSSFGDKKFKPIVEKYAFLQNMPLKKLASTILQHKPEHDTLYKETAFSL